MPDSPARTLAEVFAVGRFMTDFPAVWWIGGGWAVDLWTGSASREHEDIEICVLREHQNILYEYCRDWQFFKPVNHEWTLMHEDERLSIPDAMLQLRRTAGTKVDTAGMPPEFEFILNDVHDGQWHFRFEPGIQRPLEKVFCVSPSGLPVTVPEIVLLHKAWYPPRLKDEHDFQRVRHRLNSEQREWLRDNLKRIQPAHAWLSQL